MSEIDEDRLIRLETNHRLTNQLTVVSSILALAADEAPTEDAARHLESAAGRVRSIATVHRLLLDRDEGGTIPIDTVLADLCKAWDEIYPLAITFDGDAPNVYLPDETVMRLAMIVGELVASPCTPTPRSITGSAVSIASRKKAGTLVIEVHGGTADARSEDYGNVGSLIMDGFTKQLGANCRREHEGISTTAYLELSLT